MNRVNLPDLVSYTDELLEIDRFKDYCPNGLQVEGKSGVGKIVSGVTASLALIDAALAVEADVLLVHHGYFWRNEPATLVGSRRQRILRLLTSGMNLLAYHLPLDAHPLFGNNAQLAEQMGCIVDGRFGADVPAIGMYGHLPQARPAREFARHLENQLGRPALHIGDESTQIRTVAWCSGAAQSYLPAAIALGVDAFVTGEISEWCVHMARENAIHYFAAGHHATERYGVRALGDHLAQHFGIEHQFIEIANPA